MVLILKRLVKWLTRYSEELSGSYWDTKRVSLGFAGQYAKSTSALIKEAKEIEKYLEE